jgi:hypothetical protein
MQGTNESKDYLRVENSEVAQVLMNVSKQHLLAPFFAQEITVSKAALQAGVADLVMFRQVKRFENLGIVQVTRTEARQGRALKYYQTTAKEFFIPAKVLPLERTLEQVAGAVQKIFLHNLVKTIIRNEPTGDLGTRLSLSYIGTGNISVELAVAPGKNWNPNEMEHTAIEELWIMTNLSLEEAKALQQELSDISKRYAKPDGPQKYLLRLGLTPVE